MHTISSSHSPTNVNFALHEIVKVEFYIAITGSNFLWAELYLDLSM